MSLSSRIKEIRESLGLSPAEFSRLIGVTKSSMSHIEKDIPKTLRIETLIQIQKKTGFRIEWIHSGELPKKANLSSVAIQMAVKIEALDPFSKGKVESYIEGLLAGTQPPKEVNVNINIKAIPGRDGAVFYSNIQPHTESLDDNDIPPPSKKTA